MGTRDRKARLAVVEKAHAPTAGLPYMQAQITNSKTSMSAIASITLRIPLPGILSVIGFFTSKYRAVLPKPADATMQET